MAKKDKKKSTLSAMNNIFDSIFSEFSELARFFIGWFAFMVVFMTGPMLLTKLHDWLSPNEKIDKTELLKTDTVHTIKSLEKNLSAIDSLYYKLEEETIKKRNILKNKIDEFKRVTEANFVVDSIHKEYGITKKLPSTHPLAARDLLNWIVTAIITLIGGGFFYWLGRRAARRKILQKK